LKYVRSSVIRRRTLIHAAFTLGRSVREIAGRLEELGFTVPDTIVMPTPVSWADVRLISRDLDGGPPWLRDDEQVAVGHLVLAATHLARGLPEPAGRLRELGWAHPPDITPLPADIDATDLKLISRDLNGSRPWLDEGAPVSRIHLIRAALDLSPAQAAGRLRE